MTQKILFRIKENYDPKDVRDLIGDYIFENEKLVITEKQLSILVLAYKGDQYWFKNGKLHRDTDLPALIRADGSQYWFRKGKFHRDNLPAVIHPDGSQEWYKNNKLIKSEFFRFTVCPTSASHNIYDNHIPLFAINPAWTEDMIKMTQ